MDHSNEVSEKRTFQRQEEAVRPVRYRATCSIRLPTTSDAEWLMFLGDPKIESMMQQQASRYQ